MKFRKCKICGNKTHQKSICALCEAGITQMEEELIDLLKKDQKWDFIKKFNKKA